MYLLLVACCHADPRNLSQAHKGGRQIERPPRFTQVRLWLFSFSSLLLENVKNQIAACFDRTILVLLHDMTHWIACNLLNYLTFCVWQIYRLIIYLPGMYWLPFISLWYDPILWLRFKNPSQWTFSVRDEFCSGPLHSYVQLSEHKQYKKSHTECV